ncbi:hypothetical protein F4692_003042 [Nocardioides cavernae]|uniref:alpha-amylase n=1 Tax=Nocardioides cavernae TaxID=1921566 RepID=A0A7Y9H4R2_9ACTN|nr:carboxypeptidase regulatory-like domain-containing protein [Nocardioides cavernae]NYE37897.1 hypothetical protein [Nocardioides cavernae]
MLGSSRPASVLLTTVLLALVGALLPASYAGAAVGTATVRGTVLATGGAPLAGVKIDLYERSGPDATWVSVATTSTDVDGDYVLSDVEPGTYRVGFDDLTGTYVDEYWSNWGTIEESDDLEVSAGESVENVSAVLAPPYVPIGIRGAITGSVGGLRSTDRVKVTAYQLADGAWAPSDFIWTSFDGTYRLNLKAGTYRIGFTEEKAQLVPEFWDDAATVELASDIAVEEDTVSPGHDAVLTPVAPVAPPAQTPVAPPAQTPVVAPAAPASPPLALTNETKPTISGKAVVGKRLRVARGDWVAATRVSFTYQWLADGRRIKHATGVRLKVTKDLVGKRLKVRVTARTADATVVVTTARTPKVAA